MHTEHTSMIFSLLAAAGRIERRFDRKISMTSGISFTEYRLLKALQTEHDGIATRVDLANTINLTPSAVTRALKPLEKIGYINAEKSARDARQSLASLSSAATVVLANSDKLIQDEIALLQLQPEMHSAVAEFLSSLVWH